MSALEAMRDRRSWSKVTDLAPTGPELEAFVAAAGRVADHKSLKPWRLIEIRGADRDVLARALNKADGKKGLSSKPRRAPLIIAVVANLRSKKIPAWEQEAVASGVAHMLSLVLDEAGFGVFWRTDDNTRSKVLAKAHGLEKGEVLLGWLYVGGKPARTRATRRKTVDAAKHLSRMPGGKKRRTVDETRL
ncbi:nitroreductase [Microbacterium sp. AG157]|uniref:Putative NAD(P)H nitroreductase n=2 Tax=Microbacteriaceae TaxID=85023 RepID=A0A4Y3QJM6_MICTE|nr:nitroreductase [Microbacterium sp. AG157]GEB45097.1 NAD(P)H nitroreductase [Microbacterium testaceum]